MTPLQEIQKHPGQDRGIRLFIKRDDLVHPKIQGNKWRKLHLLLTHLVEQKTEGIVTFGGAFSNHLHAVAAAGGVYGLQTVAIIRGKYIDLNNPTLAFARAQGMILLPIDKRIYDAKKGAEIDEILAEYAGFYLLPEGGATDFALQGCQDIAIEIIAQMTAMQLTSPYQICVPAGTGCTAAGVTIGMGNHGKTHIFQAAKQGVTKAGIEYYIARKNAQNIDYQFIEQDFTFGG
jgi:1-aminocyclopropane-1-carboxylate deaminase